MKTKIILSILAMVTSINVNAQMAFDSASFIENNSALMSVHFFAAIAFFYGLYRQSIWICAIPVIGVGLNMFFTSMYLHLYCAFTGTDIESTNSFNYAVLASLATIVALAVLVERCYERYWKNKTPEPK
jgi:hypothetical protein